MREHRGLDQAALATQSGIAPANIAAIEQGAEPTLRDAATLARLAGEVGMDPTAVARLLATDADADDIQSRDMDARQKGVTAVPTFLIAQQYVVSGAQPPEMWRDVIDELTAQAQG